MTVNENTTDEEIAILKKENPHTRIHRPSWVQKTTAEIKVEVEKKIAESGLTIDWVDYGIAARFGKTVVMNKGLLQHGKYLWSVVDHEIRHSNTWSNKDLAMDLVEGDFWENLKFCCQHPRAFTQLAPFGKYKETFYYDTNLIILYSVIVIGLIIIMSL